MNKSDRPLRRTDNLARSFAHALGGIAYTVAGERNFRIHCAAAGYVLYFSRYYPFGKTEYSLIILLLGFVMVCELINTSVEKAVDVATPVFNPLAKIAKDVAAGAVLVSAITSALVGILLFWEPEILARILGDLAGAPLVWLFLLLLTVAWIFLPQKIKNPGRK